MSSVTWRLSLALHFLKLPVVVQVCHQELKVEAGKSKMQDHPWLLRELGASLGCLRPYLNVFVTLAVLELTV